MRLFGLELEYSLNILDFYPKNLLLDLFDPLNFICTIWLRKIHDQSINGVKKYQIRLI